MRELTQFQKAALNTKQHIALTANAGSGKTTILCKRYLDILLESNVHVKDIAAITFTDKAASELYDAVTGEIADRLSELKLSKSAANKEEINQINYTIVRLENIRRDLVFSKISTIHSFCLDILKENPVEANIDANCIPIDGKTASDLINQSVDEVIKELLDSNDEDVKSLIRQFSDVSILSKNIYDIIQKRIVAEKLDNFYSKSIQEIAGIYNDITINLYKEFYSGIMNKITDLIIRINNIVVTQNSKSQFACEVKNQLADFDPNDYSINSIIKFQNILEQICTKDGKIKTVGYFTKKLRDTSADVLEELDSFSDDIESLRKNSKPDTSFNEELAGFGKKIFTLFKLALTRYKGKKNDSGFLDFEDILILSKELLANTEVQQQISQKYKFVMVDEYQDTNFIQYEIILPIVDFLKKGNLFVVGDEKQSIYGFRNAELEVFDRTKKEIGNNSNSGLILTMPDNFRMVPEICFFTNQLFRNLFESEPRLLFNEVKNSDLVYGRPDNFSGKIEFIINPISEDNGETEAELVAKRILNLVEKEKVLLSKAPTEQLSEIIEWKNIAVLSRVRKSFDKLIPVLTKYKIPYVIIKGQGFYQQQEILDICSYLSFLLDENNDAALITILRSPFFLLSDVDLYEISLERGDCFYDKLCQKAKTEQKFTFVVDILSENLGLVHSSNLVHLIRKILNENYYLVLAAKKEDGKQTISNIEKLINIASDFISDGFKNIFDFVDLLENSINNADKESLGTIVDDSNAVNLTVVHQVKGLEYPAVFLYDCKATGQSDVSKSKKVLIDKNFGIITKVTLDQNYFKGESNSLLVDLINKVTALKQEAELKRLLYVAITRARNYLCISTDYKNSFPKNSFIYLINKGLADKLDAMPIEISMSGSILRTDGNTLELNFNIPVVQSIDMPGTFIQNDNYESAYKYLTGVISDNEEEEVISATKMALYNQCPVKYEITYNYGLKDLIEDYQIRTNKVNRKLNNSSLDVKVNTLEEDDFTIPGTVRGTIIHYLLQNEVKLENIDVELKKIITKNFGDNFEGDVKNDFISDLVSLISNYKDSKAFKYISSFPDYKNEFELYVKENDYFLFGIIDKIIFDRDRGKIIIVDYKTDDIELKEIKKRKENYINQLKFYSYIASKLFKNFESFEVLLVFIKHPDFIQLDGINRQELESFGVTLKDTIKNIRCKNFIKNTKHCSVCNYYIKHKDCIMDIKD